VAIGRCRGSSERDTVSIHDRGTFDAPLPPIYRAPPRRLAATRSLGDAAVNGHFGKLQTDDSIVGFEHDLAQFVHQTGLDPLVAPTAQRSRRTLLVSDPPVGASEHQNLNQLLEDHPVGYPRSVAAEWMVGLPLGQ